MQQIRELVTRGELGRVYAVDLVFHHAHGPAATWFSDKASSGGGCVIDLGVHLVDLALWMLDFPKVLGVDSRLFTNGEAIEPSAGIVEDFANVHVYLAGGVIMRLSCSWGASAGRDAVIEASVFGTAGGAAMKNVNGSFYDFAAERYTGTRSERLTSPPDAWGGHAAVTWTKQLTRSAGFDPGADRHVEVARVLDAIYERRPSTADGSAA
jgi:predicted dehydrogenase